MQPDRGIILDGKQYTLVVPPANVNPESAPGTESYSVQDVPAHPDSDSRMERRVLYDNFAGGVKTRRDTPNQLDASIYSLSIYQRIEKGGDGIWWASGADTRMGDRIMAQRAVSASNTTLASAPVQFGDATNVGGTVNYSWIACKQHFYVITGISGGVQQITLSKDFTSTGFHVTNAVAYGGRVYVALADLTNGVVDPAKPKGFYTWDVTTATTNWQGPAPSFNGGTSSSTTITPTVGGTAGTTTWGYEVYPVDSSGNVGFPSGTSVTTGPAQLTATNNVALSWTAVTGAASYSIKRVIAGGNTATSSPAGTGFIKIGNTGTTFTDTGFPIIPGPVVTPARAVDDSGNAIDFGVVDNVLWRAAGPRMWSYDGGAQEGTWSGETVVGDPNTNITALDLYLDGLVIFKQDGIYTVDKANPGGISLFPGFKSLGPNPRPLGAWGGSYFFAADGGTIWEWNGSNVKHVGFDMAELYPFPDGSYGIPDAATRAASLPNCMIVGFNQYQGSGAFSHYLAWDGGGWHPFHYDRTSKASAIGLTNANVTPSNPMLQFGGGQGVITYLDKPTLNPQLVSSFDTGNQIVYLPIDKGIIADEWKVLEGMRIYLDNAPNGTILVAYAADDDIDTLTFTDMGDPDGKGGTVQTFYFPFGQRPSFRRILFKLTITSLVTTATPVLRTIVMRYKQREPQRKSWTLNLLLEKGAMKFNKSKEARSAGQMLRHLNTLRREKRLVEFEDLIGETHEVYVERVEEVLRTWRNDDNNPTFSAKVILVEPVDLLAEDG